MTAKQLFDKMLSKNNECTSTEMMIEFAKIHVKAALDKAYENAEATIFYHAGDYGQPSAEVNKESILNAYPDDNIN